VGEVVMEGYASAAAAGSMFVYHGPRKAVLINYPNREELDELFSAFHIGEIGVE
jgi:cyclase